jgi:hypothetical protein
VRDRRVRALHGGVRGLQGSLGACGLGKERPRDAARGLERRGRWRAAARRALRSGVSQLGLLLFDWV